MHAADRPLTVLRITIRDLVRRPVRTTLTSLGVGVGVVAIVALSTITQGLWKAIDGTVHVNDADLMILEKGVAADILSVLDEARTREGLQAMPEVRGTVASLWHILPIEHIQFCLAIGMRLDAMHHFGSNLVDGRGPENDEEVALGVVAQQMLDKHVGDTLHIRDEEYKVVGVVRSPIVFVNGGVFMSLPRLQALAGRGEVVTTFQVFLKPGSDVKTVAKRIEHDLPYAVAISSAGEYSKADPGLEILSQTVGVVSIVATIIGAIIVANTMWMSVLERTREIGILRAVGWSRGRIVLTVIAEAAGLGVFAAVLGSFGGIGLAELAARMPSSGQFIDPAYTVWPFALALVVAVALSVLGAAMPAWRAARVSPAEALRYE